MEKPQRDFWLTLLILLPLFVFQTADFLCAAATIGSESATGGNREQQDEEITSEIPRIKVDVSLVTTDVTVLGTSAPQLQAEDFIILDNDVPQKLSHFSHNLLPLAVAVLIDRSSSIEEYLPLLQTAAVSALGHLKPEDQVALFAFDDSPLKLSDLTEDHDLIAKIIGRLSIGNGTNLYDAIVNAALYLRIKAPDRRRAIILVSDNCQTMPGGSGAERAKVAVLESAATLYSIKTPGENYAAEIRERDPKAYDSVAMVQRIAEETGGEIFDVGAPGSLQAALEKAISTLRLQYTLGFSPSNLGEDGSYHKLTVKLASEDRCRGCRLLARSGYYAGILSPVPRPVGVRESQDESQKETDPSLTQRSILAAGTIGTDLTEISFTVKTEKQIDANGKPQIKIDLHIDFAGIAFKIAGNQYTCKIHIAVFDVDAKGRILGSEWQTLEGKLSGESYNQIIRDGLAFSLAIPQRARKQTLRIVLYDEQSGTVGSKLVDFW